LLIELVYVIGCELAYAHCSCCRGTGIGEQCHKARDANSVATCTVITIQKGVPTQPDSA